MLFSCICIFGADQFISEVLTKNYCNPLTVGAGGVLLTHHVMFFVLVISSDMLVELDPYVKLLFCLNFDLRCFDLI